MTQTHTPGPWTYENDWSGLIHLTGAHGVHITTLQKHAVNTLGVSASAHAELQNANARLIAAAPDMLAALRMAHHALEGRERKDVALDAVAAAIARATS